MGHTTTAMKRPPPRDDAAAGGGGGVGGGARRGTGGGAGGSGTSSGWAAAGGGGGLSLAAFANAKSRNTGYNPTLIKKQKEFYRNAKLISQYKRLRKQQNDSISPPQFPIPEKGGQDAKDVQKPHNTNKKRTAQSLKEVYEKKHAEDEKAKKERDTIIKAKEEEREKSEAKRKDLREKMFKKTRSGQPVMKYRIEH